MGRPYAKELERFPETFAWAQAADVVALEGAVARASPFPLVTVGSGGAYTAAEFMALWHQRFSGHLARAMTPLQVVAQGGAPRACAVALFSASGENRDIRGAFSTALATEPPVMTVMTAAPRSRLAQAARDAQFPVLFACDVPAGRDGFLATNSLLAFCLLVHRAYVRASGLTCEALPKSYMDFVMKRQGSATRRARAENSAFLRADSIVVLHGHTTRVAAVDLESKCTEAALAHVQVADYRNFAHGRHHWLAKRNSAVLALSTTEDDKLAARTVALLPKRIPVLHMRAPFPGMLGGLRCLVDVMSLVCDMGSRRKIDPGRPGVPKFGRDLYSLRVPTTRNLQKPLDTMALTSIRRKRARLPSNLVSEGDLDTWYRAYERARGAIENATFAGVVFDYDGTLLDAAERYLGPVAAVSDALNRLLNAGVPVGIATGRGHSVGRDLRARLEPALHDRVLVGYYNGGEVTSLQEANRPDAREDVQDALKPIVAGMRGSKAVASLAKIIVRLPQITVELDDVAHRDEVWDAVQGVVLRSGREGIRVFQSGHSIDVLAPGVTKMNVITAIRQKLGTFGDLPVLRIGDRARWPGNDAELLAGLDGLSVNEVSTDPDAAWNFAPPGRVGVRAMLTYCGSMRVEDGVVRIPNLEAGIDTPQKPAT